MTKIETLPQTLPKSKDLLKLIKNKSNEKTSLLVRTSAVQVKDYIDKLYVCMAGLLERVYIDNLWAEWGFNDIYHYAEVELEFGRRKTDYLRNIYRTLVTEYKLKQEEIEELSWTKAREIPRIAENAEEAKSMIKEFKNLTVDEIKTRINKKKTNGKAEVMTRRSFTLAESQAEHVDNAFKVASAMSKSDKPGHLLDMICFDFLSGHTNSRAGIKKSLKDFERVFKLKIVALNEQGKVVYGKKYIEELG